MNTTTVPLLTSEIQAGLSQLEGWSREGDTLIKIYKFGSFREALSFMVRAGFEAEALSHHPNWTNVYNRLEIRLSTHDAGDKITAKDMELAKRLQAISWVG